MANELFNTYLSYVERVGEEFAIKKNLEIEDVIQDARVYLLEYSENYNMDISDFHKHFIPALSAHIKRAASKYMVCGYPSHMSRQIQKLMDVFSQEMPFTDNIHYISNILHMSEDEAAKVLDCYITVIKIRDKVSIDDVDECEFAINDNYFAGHDEIDVIKIVNRYCSCRESDIFIRITGLIGRKESALSICQDYGVSKPRIWQLYKSAQEKMNRPEVRRELKQLLISSR